MSKVAPSLPPAPEGQQGPPTFAAARCEALRVARGSLPLTSGTASRGDNKNENGARPRRDAEATRKLDGIREH
jgi:hypothetical protein